MSQPETAEVHVSPTLHCERGHWRFVLQLFVELQVTSQLHEVAQFTPLRHASGAEQSTVQLPRPHVMGEEQAPVAQRTSQAEEVEQLMLLHAPASHVTLQGPEPQRMGEAHAFGGHVMSQLEARLQSSVLLHPPSTQSILQGNPEGQTTGLLQLVTEQSITHVFPWQVPFVHAARQPAVAAPPVPDAPPVTRVPPLPVAPPVTRVPPLPVAPPVTRVPPLPAEPPFA